MTKITITNEYTDGEYRYLTIKGLAKYVDDEVRVYGCFDRVIGGVVYSAPDDDHFDDLFTDDVNHLTQ